MQTERLREVLSTLQKPVDKLTTEEVEFYYNAIMNTATEHCQRIDTQPFYFISDDIKDTLTVLDSGFVRSLGAFGVTFRDHVKEGKPIKSIYEYAYLVGVCDQVASIIFDYFQGLSGESAVAKQIYEFMRTFATSCLDHRNDGKHYQYVLSKEKDKITIIIEESEDECIIPEIQTAPELEQIFMAWLFLFDPVAYIRSGYEFRLDNADEVKHHYNHILKDYERVILNQQIPEESKKRKREEEEEDFYNANILFE